MMEMIVFAITLVVAQTVAGFVVMRLVMTKAFFMKYFKMSMELMKEIQEMEFDFMEED